MLRPLVLKQVDGGSTGSARPVSAPPSEAAQPAQAAGRNVPGLFTDPARDPLDHLCQPRSPTTVLTILEFPHHNLPLSSFCRWDAMGLDAKRIQSAPCSEELT